MTFPTDPPPEFRSVTFQLYAPPDGERLATALASNGAAVPMQVREHLAYTLYGSAFFLEASPEARFMMLMMSFESLMKPEGRSPEARAAVDGFVRYIENARDLDAGEQQALIDAIQLQKRESLTQAGMRLAANLGEQTYAGKSPRDFFKHIYKVRGRLAHPRGTGVSVVDVESLLGPLQEFVGDVLAGPALRGDPSGRPR